MLKQDKIVQLKNPIGKTFRIIREQYLREDIPCHSQLCLSDCNDYCKKNFFFVFFRI